MTMVADAYTHVVGVDTHAATHHYAILETRTGAVLDHRAFPTTTPGLLRATDWITRRTTGNEGNEGNEGNDGNQTDRVLISMEGTRSYGTQAAAVLTESGYRVTDAPSPRRERGQGKNDHIDAVTAARGILGRDIDRLADIRTGHTSGSLQILLTARTCITTERTAKINALHALLRTHDLGVDARRALSRTTITTIAGWRTRSHDDPTQTHARREAIRLATRVLDLDLEARDNLRSLTDLVEAAAPTLLELPGVGPVNAAIVLTAWSHPGRIHSEAAFAKLGGVCPLEISSGNRHEHRLNRTGDRQLNKALYSIANERMKRDPATRAYVERRQRENLTKRRIRRCLKRYIARDLYRHLESLDRT